MASYYDDLLRLCGFEVEEIEKERERIDNAFRKLEIGPEDMEIANNWVRMNHDVTLTSVRKLLGAWLKELIDLAIAKDEGKKIIYYGFPAMVRPGMLIKASSENVYCACPDALLCHTMGQIFNKLTPILEAGEENGLPPGHALCSLWQIKVGALAKGMIPAPDLAIASSYFCDMGSKADDLLAERYGTPIIYIDGSMDSAWGDYPEYLPERVEFLGAELNHLFDMVKEVAGVEITQDAWDKTESFIRSYYGRLGRITQLMNADPVPVGSAAIELATILPPACTGRGVSEASKALAILTMEIQTRIDKGIGVVEKGAPRVMQFIGNFSDASISRMIENAGLAVPVTFFTAPTPRVEPTTSYSTMGEKMADSEMRQGLYHSSYGLIKRTEMAMKHTDLDGLIENYLFNCRPVAIISHSCKKWIEENTGIPTLSLENDIYDTRSYSAAAMRTRLETFAEMLKAKKASAGIKGHK
ncbi:MAG: 2-hydroxyacyl-CoA dehydratase family protein [Thermodesulfobacteriota bacterium]|nr:2-hydroxyacyl-CoA dehydratase family protein [Thermodesulfobacteriota bacterium]